MAPTLPNAGNVSAVSQHHRNLLTSATAGV
jgi:hypothetical protein